MSAYMLCLILVGLLLIVLSVMTLTWKNKVDGMVEDVSAYLKEHRVLGISVTGALVSIVMGLVMTSLGVVLRTTPSVLFGGSVFLFPMSLINRWFREKVLLNPAVLRWLMIIAVTVIGVSLLYLFLKLIGVLPERRFAYHELAGRNVDIYLPGH